MLLPLLTVTDLKFSKRQNLSYNVPYGAKKTDIT